MELDRVAVTNRCVSSSEDRSGLGHYVRLLPECGEALRRLWDYVDQALPPLEAEQMREHFVSCKRCHPHVRFEVRLLRAIADVRPRPIDDPMLSDRVRRAVAHEQHDVADGW